MSPTMLKRAWLILLIIALPLITGGVASILMQAILHPVPILLFKIDIGMVAFLTGLFLTALSAAIYSGAMIRDRLERKRLKASLQ